MATTADDAAYYFRIAENIADGFGWTFDRIHPTNGVHPLWQLILVGLFRILHLRPENMLRAVSVLETALLTASLILLWRLLRHATSDRTALLAIVLYVPTVYLPTRSGMETALLVLVMTVALDIMSKGIASAGAALRFGLTLGLLMLARLDSVIFAGAFVGIIALDPDRTSGGSLRRRLALLGTSMLVAALVVAPYLWFNLATFGHLMPISGALKTSFPHPGWFYPRFGLTREERLLFVASVAAVAACVTWFFFVHRRHAAGHWPAALLALAVGAGAHAVYSCLFMRWAVFGWYFVVGRIVLCIVAAMLITSLTDRWGSRPGRLLYAATIAAVAIGTGILIARREWLRPEDDSWKSTAYDAALWIDRNLPADAIIAMKDSGNVGYFSRRRVINLDGIVSTFAYQDSIRDHHFVSYLRASGAAYFIHQGFLEKSAVGTATYENFDFVPWSYRYLTSGDTLSLPAANELYRSAPFHSGASRTMLVLWSIPPAR